MDDTRPGGETDLNLKKKDTTKRRSRILQIRSAKLTGCLWLKQLQVWDIPTILWSLELR